MFDDNIPNNPVEDFLASENSALREENRRLANPVLQTSTYTAPYPVDNGLNMFGDFDVVKWEKTRASTAHPLLQPSETYWIHHKTTDKWSLISPREFEDILRLIFLKSAEHVYTEKPL